MDKLAIVFTPDGAISHLEITSGEDGAEKTVTVGKREEREDGTSALVITEADMEAAQVR